MMTPVLGAVFDLAWQTSALLATGLLAATWLRCRPARAHVVLALAVVLACVVPLASRAIDAFGGGYLAPRATVEVADAHSSARARVIDETRVPKSASTPATSTTVTHPSTVPTNDGLRDARPASRPVGTAPLPASNIDAATFAFACWALASLVLLTRLVIAGLRSARIVRTARPVQAGDAHDVYERVNIERLDGAKPVLLESDAIRCPAFWGWSGRSPARGAILIPSDRPSDEHVDWEAVLTHELAHAARRDHRTQLIASLFVCLVPWQVFGWWARRRLAWLADLACDDGVLGAGSARSSYAETLLAFVPAKRSSWVTTATTRGKSLRQRIARILTDATPAPPTASRRETRAAVFAGIALAFIVACAQPARSQPGPQSAPLTTQTARDVLSGVVINEGGVPVEGVDVTLVREFVADPRTPVQGHLDRDLAQTRTDNLGRFELDGLRPGWVTLMLDHPDYARTFSAGDPRLETGRRDVRLVIPRGLTLRGRVTVDGQPLANTKLDVGAPNLSHRPIGAWDVTTDSEGRFELLGVSTFISRRVSSGSPIVFVRVGGAGWTSDRYAFFDDGSSTLPFAEIEAWRVGEDADAASRTIEVNPPSNGTSARLAGEPSGTASVHLSLKVPAIVRGRPRTVFLMGGDEGLHRMDEVDENGNLLFDQLPAGRYTLAIPNIAQPMVSNVTVELADGEARDVVIEPGPIRLHGTVQCGGEPVREGIVDVNAWQVDALNGFGQGYGVVHEDGTWEVMGLPPGKYRLTFNHGRGQSAPNHFVVDVTESDTRFDIVLPTSRIDFTIEGAAQRVLHSDPDEAAWIDPLFLSVMPGGNAPMGGNTGGIIDLTDDPSFVEHLPAGPWTLSMRDDGVAYVAKVDLPTDASRVTAALVRRDAGPGVVRGTIRAAQGSSFVVSSKQQLAVTAYPVESFGLDVTTGLGEDQGGLDDYTISGLSPGTYGLLFCPKHEGFRPPTENPSVPFFYVPNVVVPADAAVNINVEVPRARSVLIDILDANGKSTPRATWKLAFAVEGSGVGDFVPFSAIVGSSPRALSAINVPFPLPVGRHVLEVTRRGEPPEHHVIAVERGADVQTFIVPVANAK